MFILFFISQVLAGIFGEDSRFEGYLSAHSQQLQLARATPALIRPHVLLKQADGNYLTMPRSAEQMNICPDVQFAEQPFLANCSASLIAKDLILTAAHCIDVKGPSVCGDFKIVFDFAMGEEIQTFKAAQVYECKKVEYYRFDLPAFKEDIALIRLDREVLDRTPIELDLRELKMGESLEMMGYPLGLPLKGVDAGKVTSTNLQTMSFRHDLDTFSCNSGGPVFSSEGKQVGVLVRGTTANLQKREGSRCYEWGQARHQDYAEANHLFHLKDLLNGLITE